MSKRVVVNLWHGIPLKKLYALWNKDVRDRLDRVKYRHFERKKYSGLITSSTMDSFAMAAMFHPIKYEHVWVTGLPRNDFVLKNVENLPAYLKHQVSLVQKLKAGRKLITYAPTYRQTVAVTDSKYYQFTNEEIAELKKILKKHNAIFGFRMHYFRNDLNLFNMEDYVDNEYIFDLGHNFMPEIAPVIRESDMVISDYSSVFVEALYVNKPVFAFTYDIEHYKTQQDGLLYDFDLIFPSDAIITFAELLQNIDQEFTLPQQTSSEKYRHSQKFFYEYIDTKNAERVVTRVKETLEKGIIG
jgi:CDP-glycerol glycerophosphotransferase